MNRIRKGDEVVVVTGKDSGRRGTVIRLAGDGRVVVEGINMVKKHQKPNPTRGVAGGILEIEAPLHLSNVMLWNPATDKPDRIGYRTLEDGRKVRFFKSNNEVLDA
jgi:large subunit ribosomal protein L24